MSGVSTVLVLSAAAIFIGGVATRHRLSISWGCRSMGGLLFCKQKISVRSRVAPPICLRSSTAENDSAPHYRPRFDHGRRLHECG